MAAVLFPALHRGASRPILCNHRSCFFHATVADMSAVALVLYRIHDAVVIANDRGDRLNRVFNPPGSSRRSAMWLRN